MVLFSPDCHPTVTLLSDKRHLIAPSVQSPAFDVCFQSILPPTVEFDSAAAALRIFHIPVQRKQPPFSLDSAAACQPAHLASIVLPSLPSAPAGIYTVACQESGKDAHIYPTHAELYCRTPQHHLHCYKAEAELPCVIYFLIKLNWLDKEDLGVLSMIHPTDFKAMAISIPRLLQVNFANLRDPVPDYASHTLIAPTRMRFLTACALHYNLDFGLVTRYLGGEYTSEWGDVNEIISTCEPIVSPEVLSQMEHILTTGCPSYFNWE